MTALQDQKRSWPWTPRSLTVLLVEDRLSQFKRRFAPNLASARAAMKGSAADPKEWNQGPVAIRIGTSEATYRRWENASLPHVPDVYQLVLLAEQFKWSVRDLIDPEPMTPREIAMSKQILRGRQRGMERVRRAEAPPARSRPPRPPRVPPGSTEPGPDQ